nr:MAG TPA: hypothetical protein [Caudoviricetes sp.]
MFPSPCRIDVMMTTAPFASTAIAPPARTLVILIVTRSSPPARLSLGTMLASL